MEDNISSLIFYLTYKQQYHLNFPKLEQNAFTTTSHYKRPQHSITDKKDDIL